MASHRGVVELDLVNEIPAMALALNTLPLGSYVVLDLFVSRALARWAEVFVGVENLFGQTYSTGRTSEGVVSIGAPRLVHGGLRLAF